MSAVGALEIECKTPLSWNRLYRERGFVGLISQGTRTLGVCVAEHERTQQNEVEKKAKKRREKKGKPTGANPRGR